MADDVVQAQIRTEHMVLTGRTQGAGMFSCAWRSTRLPVVVDVKLKHFVNLDFDMPEYESCIS